MDGSCVLDSPFVVNYGSTAGVGAQPYARTVQRVGEAGLLKLTNRCGGISETGNCGG
jgi:hypothetical protein